MKTLIVALKSQLKIRIDVKIYRWKLNEIIHWKRTSK